MNKKNLSISFFMPAYNEEKNILKAIQKAYKVLGKITDDYEINIIDDGSTDKTASIVRKMQQKLKSLKIISHSSNRGYGYALRTGIISSNKQFTFYTDADNQFDITKLKKAIRLIDLKTMIIGYRYHRQDSWQRLVSTFIYKLLIGFLFNIWVRDINCSFKLFPTSLYKKNKLKSKTIFVDAEMLILAKKAGYQIKEIPIPHFKREAGNSKFENINKGFFMVIRPDKITELLKEIIRLRPFLN